MPSTSLYWDTESLDTARLRRLHGVVVDRRDVREKDLLAAPRGREVGVGVGAGGEGEGVVRVRVRLRLRLRLRFGKVRATARIGGKARAGIGVEARMRVGVSAYPN